VISYNQQPLNIIKTAYRDISSFDIQSQNIEISVVESFGEEWKKFQDFQEDDLKRTAAEYFDILDDTILTKNSYCLDAGCGTGRYTKVLADRVGFFEAVDPSEAIFAADNLLKNTKNVRITKASIEKLPFPDNTFDFVMSIGVLHHIPDTQKAMQNCVDKVKKGGYFYIYLYYSLDNKNMYYKWLFNISALFRGVICKLPSVPKKIVCDILAIIFYMPFVILGQLFAKLGFHELAKNIPLSYYQNKSFYIIRNDALDRFGTSLEHRFSKAEIENMMTKCGLIDIIFSNKTPYWHAVGKKN
jgi:ubiquinone/menaquinone biosynthesis C-methylase UbiE